MLKAGVNTREGYIKHINQMVDDYENNDPKIDENWMNEQAKLFNL